MEDDLISRTALLSAVDGHLWISDNLKHLIHDIASGVPTVKADIIVRCKDCEYWKKAHTDKQGFLVCPVSGMKILAQDFCSRRQRRDERA